MMSINLKFSCLIVCFLFSLSLFAQRGLTGDKTFADRYPPDVNNQTTNTYLKVENTVDHDIIVCIRDQNKKYLNHIYIRKIFDKSWKCVLRSRRRMKLLEEMEKMNKPMNERIIAYKNVSREL